MIDNCKLLKGENSTFNFQLSTLNLKGVFVCSLQF